MHTGIPQRMLLARNSGGWVALALAWRRQSDACRTDQLGSGNVHYKLLKEEERIPEYWYTLTHQALWCHVDMTLGRHPDCSWRRRRGRPSNRWLDQLHGDNNTPPADL